MIDKNYQDLMTPIRTRGAIRLPEEAIAEDASPRSIRTRGAMRTRGTAGATVTRRASTLDSVLLELREQVGHFPLTVLVHGWGSPAAGAFFSLIGPLLRRDDAVWMLSSQDAQGTTTPIMAEEGVVLLDLRHDTDQRIYNTLVGDVLFFPALHQTEATQVAAWQRRARVLIVDGQGRQRAAVLRAGQAASLMTYRWSGELALH